MPRTSAVLPFCGRASFLCLTYLDFERYMSVVVLLSEAFEESLMTFLLDRCSCSQTLKLANHFCCMLCSQSVLSEDIWLKNPGCFSSMPKYVELPVLIKYFLIIVQIGTAAAAFMAIRILLDHGVREDRIIFVTFLVARGGGVSVLRRAFPQVKIVCGAVDDLMQEGWLEGYQAEGNPEGLGRKIWVMQPGMGQIGSASSRSFFDSSGMLKPFCAGDRYYL